MTIHLEKPDTYQDELCCLTHTVGLPKHPGTKQEMPLTPYQVEFFNTINEQKKPKPGQDPLEAKRDPHKFHINKGRQMGFTEIVLRVIQYYCFRDYAGSNVGIMAATNGRLALKDLRRLARLFQTIPAVVKEWVRGNTMHLVNGTTIEAFKASEESITGDTNYKCVFMDEAAKWKNIDDTPVFNSVEPVVNSGGADLFLVSTPKYPIKTFYEIHKHPKSYYKIVYDIWHALDNMYTRPQIEDMIASSQGDPAQEYMCQFRFGKDSVLGEVNDDERTDEKEWAADEDDADDSYIEPDDYEEGQTSFENKNSVWRPGTQD